MRELSSEENMDKGFDGAFIKAGSTRPETVTGWGSGEDTMAGALDCAGSGEGENEFELTVLVSAAGACSNAGAGAGAGAGALF
jgi:hypothetical protein